MNFVSAAVILPIFFALYLFDRYKKQRYKNLSTLYWSLGYIVLSFVALFHFVFSLGLLSSMDFKIFYLLRALAFNFGLVFIYLGVIRLVSGSLILRYFVPVFIFTFTIFGILFSLFYLQNPKLSTLIGLFGLYVPFDIAMAILFLLLHSHLTFIKDGFKSNLGPFLISLGWIIHAIMMSWLYWVADTPEMNTWFLFINIPTIFWILGTIILQRESEKSFLAKIKIHGLRKKKE